MQGRGWEYAPKYELHANRSRPFSSIAASVAHQLHQLLAPRCQTAAALRCCPHPPWLTALHPPYPRPTSALQKLYFLVFLRTPYVFQPIFARPFLGPTNIFLYDLKYGLQSKYNQISTDTLTFEFGVHLTPVHRISSADNFFLNPVAPCPGLRSLSPSAPAQ